MEKETNEKDVAEQVTKETTSDKKNEKKFINKKKHVFGILLIVLLIAVICILVNKLKPEAEKVIISETSLRKIINVSDLSTYQAIYNGVAEVKNDKGKTQYFVSYDAKVKAGFDFSKIDIQLDQESKRITITIPEIEITDVSVEIESMEYIFVNDKANTETVSQEAYKACIEDVENESANENAIYKLAEKNAKNVVEALVKPFIEQLDEEYVLEIQ